MLLVGQHEGHPDCNLSDVGLLMVTIWRDLFTSYSCPVVTNISIISIILSSNKIQDGDIVTYACLGCPGKCLLNDCSRCRPSYGPPCPPVVCLPVSLPVCLSVCLTVCPTVPSRPINLERKLAQVPNLKKINLLARVTECQRSSSHLSTEFSNYCRKDECSGDVWHFQTQLFTKTHAGSPKCVKASGYCCSRN